MIDDPMLRLAAAEREAATLRDELEKTHRGLLALTLELEQRVEDRTAQLRERAEQQAAVAELGQKALQTLDLPAVMVYAIEVVRKALGTERVLVLEWDEAREELVARHALGAGDPATLPALPWPAESFNDVQRHLRERTCALPDSDALVHGAGAAVLGGQDQPYGVLVALGTGPRVLGEGEITFLESVANVLGSAVARRRAEDAVAAHVKEVERSNAELAQFAYVASHDLQAPLRTVGSFADLLVQRLAGRLDEKTETYVTTIQSGVQRMRRLITDLLEYSRVGTAAVEPEIVPSRVAVEQALANLRESLDQSGAEVVCGELPTIKADPTQLVRLFQNLIENAIKFRSDRPLRIDLSATPRDDAWLFSVTDNGIGIEPRHKDQVFLIFKRLHSRDRYPGSGIGLSVCKKIVTRHGGDIWVEPRDEGAAFLFTWPRA